MSQTADRLPTRRRRRPVASLVARSAILALLLTCAVFATTYRLLTPSEIFTSADVVFTARVVDVTAELRVVGTREEVFTTASFELEEVLAGLPVDEEGDPDAVPDDEEEEPEGPNDFGDQGTFTLDFLGGQAAG